MRERALLSRRISEFEDMTRTLEESLALAELAEQEEDASQKDSLLLEIEGDLQALAAGARHRQLESLLDGEADNNDCYLEIHAGAGGTESQDWAEMLRRMYMRWAERHEFTPETLSESAGDEAGIKSSCLRITGVCAYGWLKTETGIHRLVRISPFDANARRHTSFSSVWVYPVIDDSIMVDIQDKDIRTDTYRASGAGGQHVNRTDSAVRLTHLPSGIVVQCQTDRSQHKNRAQAFKMLRARLYERALREREQSLKAEHEAKSDIGWGHQIRSYVLHPYQLVRDLRTGHENSSTQRVLDGDISAFLESALAERATARRVPTNRLASEKTDEKISGKIAGKSQ